MRVHDIAAARLAVMELLLLSNSTNYGESMYTHTAAAFAAVTDGRTVTFVPYALADWDRSPTGPSRRSSIGVESSRRIDRRRRSGPSSRPTSS